MYISNALELFCDPKEIFSVAICYVILFLKWMSVYIPSFNLSLHIFIERNLLSLLVFSC